MTLTYAGKIRDTIQNYKQMESNLWLAVQQHSRDYMHILKLTKSDLEILHRIQRQPKELPNDENRSQISFLDLESNSARYILSVEHVCGAPYGAGWETCVMAFCTDKPELNTEAGMGTTHITALTETEHRSLLAILST